MAQFRDKCHNGSAAGSLSQTVVLLFWIARGDQCGTDKTHAMPTARSGLAHLTAKIQSIPRLKSFRDAMAKTIKRPTHGTSNSSSRKNVSFFISLILDRLWERRRGVVMGHVSQYVRPLEAKDKA